MCEENTKGRNQHALPQKIIKRAIALHEFGDMVLLDFEFAIFYNDQGPTHPTCSFRSTITGHTMRQSKVQRKSTKERRHTVHTKRQRTGICGQVDHPLAVVFVHRHKLTHFA